MKKASGVHRRRTREEMTTCAYHEAGHLVIGHACGYSFSKATIRKESDGQGNLVEGHVMVDDAYVDNLIQCIPYTVMMHAGRQAERLSGMPLEAYTEEVPGGRAYHTDLIEAVAAVWKLNPSKEDADRVLDAALIYLPPLVRAFEDTLHQVATLLRMKRTLGAAFIRFELPTILPRMVALPDDTQDMIRHLNSYRLHGMPEGIYYRRYDECYS